MPLLRPGDTHGPPGSRRAIAGAVVLLALASAGQVAAASGNRSTLYAIDRKPDQGGDLPAMNWSQQDSDAIGSRNESPVLYDVTWRLPLHPPLNRTVVLDPNGTIDVTIHLLDDLPDQVTVQPRLLLGSDVVAEGHTKWRVTRPLPSTEYSWSLTPDVTRLSPDEGNLVWEIDLRGHHWGVWMSTDGNGTYSSPSRIELPVRETLPADPAPAPEPDPPANETPANRSTEPSGGAATPSLGAVGALAAVVVAALVGRRR